MKKQYKGLRHGEVMLIPVAKVPVAKKLPRGTYLLAHSETGHHHVLEGDQFEVTQTKSGQIYVTVFGATHLVHRKTHDKHRTLTVPPSILKRYHMVEYDPTADAITVVRD